MVSVTWNEVRARRLARSFLTTRAGADRLLDVVSDLGGVHAQVQASAELQLSARVDGITQADVRRALWEDRRLVKAWTLRGTLHLHPAGELPLWYAAARAVSPAEPGELKPWVDPNGALHPALGRDDVDEIRSAVLDALNGRCLLREELAAEVVQRIGTKVRSRLLSGFNFFGGADLCQGPPKGSKITLARPDQWIEDWEDVDEAGALREVCRRYLRTYGPARPSGFREWFASRALKSADVRALFESLGLEEVDVEGRRAFVLAGDVDFPDSAPGVVRLLPEYDVYVMGFREREHLVPEPVKKQVARHGRGRYEGPAGVRFLVIDGLTAGLWERKRRGKRIELTVTPARRLTKSERSELDGQIERIGAFLGLEPVLMVG
ncbi:MAG: winged helix DNA-binding domain-containing protein [Gaiellaceae bacterium]